MREKPKLDLIDRQLISDIRSLLTEKNSGDNSGNSSDNNNSVDNGDNNGNDSNDSSEYEEDEKQAWNKVVDAVVNNDASSAIIDLYDNDKITLRQAVKMAIMGGTFNSIVKRIYTDKLL